MSDKLLYAVLGALIGFFVCLYIKESQHKVADPSSVVIGNIIKTATTAVQELDSLKLVLKKVEHRKSKVAIPDIQRVVRETEPDTILNIDAPYFETAYTDTTIKGYGDFYVSYTFPPIDQFRMSFFPSIPEKEVITNSVLIPVNESSSWYKSRWLSFFAGATLATTAIILAK
jgi:hypothetical protein